MYTKSLLSVVLLAALGIVTLFLIENAVILDYSTFEITEDRKRNPNLLCEFAVGGNTVHAHAKNLGFG